MCLIDSACEFLISGQDHDEGLYRRCEKLDEEDIRRLPALVGNVICLDAENLSGFRLCLREEKRQQEAAGKNHSGAQELVGQGICQDWEQCIRNVQQKVRTEASQHTKASD